MRGQVAGREEAEPARSLLLSPQWCWGRSPASSDDGVAGVGRLWGARPGSPLGPAQAQVLRSLLAPEPSVEEKLQKLHSEIKFALKVDNPVRPSAGH